jgi:alginate O-acetyltransferase complex protein AlgI
VIRQRQPTQPQARRRSDFCRLGPVSRAIADPGAVRRTQFNWRPSGWAGIALSFVLVTIGWVFFRAPILADAWQYLSAMFYFGAGNESRPLAVYLTPDIQLYLAIGLFFAFVPFETLWRLRFDRPLMMMQQLGLSIVSLIYSSLLLATNSFNPFIYFRF